MDQEVIYLIGALRDANLDFRQNKNYEIKFGQKDERWLYIISEIINRHFGKNFKVKNNMLRITNKEIVNKIISVSNFRSPQGEWGTPESIKFLNDNDLIHYIRGFWDAEGGLPTKFNSKTQFYVSFDQKNKEALSFVRNKIINFGFKPTNMTYTGKVWQFRLTRKKEIIKFFELIGSIHPSKSMRLKNMVSILSS